MFIDSLRSIMRAEASVEIDETSGISDAYFNHLRSSKTVSFKTGENTKLKVGCNNIALQTGIQTNE